MVFVASAVVSATAIAQSETNNALVVKTPEQSNLILDCSFGEEGKEDCGVQHFFQLANNIMRLLLWVAVVLAGLLIFYKGTKLAINVAAGGHQKAKKEVQDALRATLWGLLFILSAYLIVKAGFDIIGYNLNDGDPFKYDESALPAPNVSKPSDPSAETTTDQSAPNPSTQEESPISSSPTPPTEVNSEEVGVCEGHLGNRRRGKSGLDCSCSDCEETPLGITFKHEKSDKVDRGLAEKLQGLNKNIDDFTWIVTEAWPPTQPHNADCHYIGTCVDIAFRKDGSPVIYNNLPDVEKEEFIEKVVEFIEAAGDIGLRAVFETRNADVANKVKSIVGDIHALTGNYTDHFSVYSD